MIIEKWRFDFSEFHFLYIDFSLIVDREPRVYQFGMKYNFSNKELKFLIENAKN